MDPSAPRFGYPVVLDLHGVGVAVVGAGPIAARKVAGLAAAGAVVTVIAPAISPEMQAEIDAERVQTVERRAYRRGDIAPPAVRFVIAATGDHAVDATVAADATAAGVWVNTADRRDDCTAILPAISRRGRITVAVSTDGASPALASRLRDRIAKDLPGGLAEVAERVAEERARLHDAGVSTEGRDWSAWLDDTLPEP